ncbi:MAG: NAD(P)H-dependent oxidoreductase [Actinomycetota bacterium]
MKLLAFAASTSSTSINRQLIDYATRLLDAGLVDDVEIDTIDLIDDEMPIYSIDRQNELGIPRAAHDFFDKIGAADAVLFSTSTGPGGGTNVLSTAVMSGQFFGYDVAASLAIPSFHDNFDTDTGTLSNHELDAQFRAALTTLNDPVGVPA